MNTQKITKISSQVYTVFSIFSIAYVSVLSIYNPQGTMDLVATRLSNTDAISSIRGIYGGVGLVICFSLVHLLLKDINKVLIFLSLFWLAYAICRLITILVDGPLAEFGSQWLVIESTLGILALVLLIFHNRFKS